MPAVTDGGRMYTFRVRKGYRFSPPSNEPVTAETFRYSIERALSPGLGRETPGPRSSETSSGEPHSMPAVRSTCPGSPSPAIG